MKLLTVLVLMTGIQVMHPQGSVPEWSKGVVWYQIFPERFANGDTANDPHADKVFSLQKSAPAGWRVTPWGANWFARDEWEKKPDTEFRDMLGGRRYGGDLQGIINRLDYLKSLGVGAIYLNPIFDAVSHHKYDGSTYHHIDVNFGPDPVGDARLIASEKPDDPSTWTWTTADMLFVELLKQAHKRGIRVVIDGVFNHTGVAFWAFQDIVKNGKNSKYVNWYQVKSFADPNVPGSTFEYKGWWNTKSLPEFNRTKDSAAIGVVGNLYPDVKAYIFAATRRWMDPDKDGDPSDGIDGWRLDVAREVPMGFWREWRQLVKKSNKDAIIIGELWEISKDFISVDGVFDGLMNYNFAYAVSNFFVGDKGMSAIEFMSALKDIDRAYPDENLFVLQNLMGSHDTERLSSMIANPGRKYQTSNDEQNRNYYIGKPKQEHYDLQKLIAAFQFLYRGAPMVYYGDEVGMWGATDPHCRKPMIWDDLQYQDEVITAASGFETGLGKYKVKIEKPLLTFYRRLGAMREYSKALRLGSIEYLLHDDNDRIIGFMRKYQDEEILVYFNMSDKSEIIEHKVRVKEVLDLVSGDRIKLNDSTLRFPLWGNSFVAYKITP